MPTTESPRPDSRRPRRRATCPWAPAMTTRMPGALPRQLAGYLPGAGQVRGGVAVQPRRRPALGDDGPPAVDRQAGQGSAHARRSTAPAHRRPEGLGAPDPEQQLIAPSVVDDEDAVGPEARTQLGDRGGGPEP